MRRSPAPAAMSPSFATTSSSSAPTPDHLGTGRNRHAVARSAAVRVHPARFTRVGQRRAGQLRSLGRRRRPVARLTGERPMAGATPDSLLALHDAGYREVAARLGAGCRARRRLRCRRADRAARGAPTGSSSASTTARRPSSRPDATTHRSRACASRAWTAPRSAVRDGVDRRGRVVAHHRALREPGAARRPSSRASCGRTAPRS